MPEPCFIRALKETGAEYDFTKIITSLRNSGQDLMLCRWIKDTGLKCSVKVFLRTDSGL